MSAHSISRLGAVLTAAAMTATIGSGAAASPAGSSTRGRRSVPVHAHWENPPDSFTVSPPCAATASIPKTGLCHGTGAGRATVTGSWRGTTMYEYGWVTTPGNLTYFTAVETFTGTIAHCGTGTLFYRLAGTVDAAGTIRDTWQVVRGFGSGGLAEVSGHGIELGAYNADFSQSGDFSGHLRCGRLR